MSVSAVPRPSAGNGSTGLPAPYLTSLRGCSAPPPGGVACGGRCPWAAAHLALPPGGGAEQPRGLVKYGAGKPVDPLLADGQGTALTDMLTL